MSYKRSARKLIPKNSDRCNGCKLRSEFSIYTKEVETNSYFVGDKGYICNYLKIQSDQTDVYDFIMNSNPSLYPEGEFEKIINEVEKAHELHQGFKICGLYPYKEKPKCRWQTKARVDINNEIDIDDDNIPF